MWRGDRCPRLEESEHLFPAYPNRGNLCPPIRGFSWAKSRMDDFLGIENWRFYLVDKAPQILADGDEVATYLQAHFKKRSNGRIVQFDMAVFYSFRNGQIAPDNVGVQATIEVRFRKSATDRKMFRPAASSTPTMLSIPSSTTIAMPPMMSPGECLSGSQKTPR